MKVLLIIDFLQIKTIRYVRELSKALVFIFLSVPISTAFYLKTPVGANVYLECDSVELLLDMIRPSFSSFDEFSRLKNRIRGLCLSTMERVYGSEEKTFEFIADKFRESFPHLKLLFEYAYGKPKDIKNVAFEHIEQPLFFAIPITEYFELDKESN